MVQSTIYILIFYRQIGICIKIIDFAVVIILYVECSTYTIFFEKCQRQYTTWVSMDTTTHVLVVNVYQGANNNNFTSNYIQYTGVIKKKNP